MWNSVPNKSGIGWAIFWCALKCFSPPVGLTVKTPLCHKQLAHKRYGLLWTARPVFLFWKICSAEHTTPAHQLNLNGLPHAVQTGDNPELSEKIPVGRGQRPSNKTWFVQNLTCQPFPSHAMQRYQRYDHACGSHVCSPDPWPVGGATFRVLELRSQLRATWLIVARSDVPNFKWFKSGLKLQCLYFVVGRCLLAYYPRSYWQC